MERRGHSRFQPRPVPLPVLPNPTPILTVSQDVLETPDGLRSFEVTMRVKERRSEVLSPLVWITYSRVWGATPLIKVLLFLTTCLPLALPVYPNTDTTRQNAPPPPPPTTI